MCNVGWRAWMVALVLLFTAGMAAGQMAPLPFQNSIAWGGPIQPDVSSGDNRSQTVTPPGVGVGTPADVSADSSSQTPSDNPADSTANSSANNSGTNTVPANPDNTIRQLGTPFPLQLQPQGLKIGPFFLTNVSDSFFYAVNTSPGQPTQTFAGNSVTGNLVSSKQFNNGGILAVQARGQFSLSQAQPYFNTTVGATFTDQLSERWSVSASADFTYFQNSILANPEYLLSYQNAGVVQQTLFVQQNASTLYESNSIAFSYQLNGRTHLSLSPILGATFLEQQTGWSSTHQFGGAVGVTRDFTPNLSLGVFYSLSHSVTSGISGSPAWNSQSLGGSFQYKFGQSWSVSGALAASGQLIAQVWTLTPTGSIRVLKAFRTSSLSAAYTRSEANNVFISSGYYDQGDIGYAQQLGQKVGLNAGVGEFRTINTGNHYYGKRAGGGISYYWTPRLSLSAGYNFAHQVGVQTSNFAPFLGNTNSFNIGLTWKLGSSSGL